MGAITCILIIDDKVCWTMLYGNKRSMKLTSCPGRLALSVFRKAHGSLRK
jgi:hypothetical protein